MLLAIWSSAIDLPHYRTSWVSYKTLSYILHCEWSENCICKRIRTVFYYHCIIL